MCATYYAMSRVVVIVIIIFSCISSSVNSYTMTSRYYIISLCVSLRHWPWCAHWLALPVAAAIHQPACSVPHNAIFINGYSVHSPTNHSVHVTPVYMMWYSDWMWGLFQATSREYVANMQWRIQRGPQSARNARPQHMRRGQFFLGRLMGHLFPKNLSTAPENKKAELPQRWSHDAPYICMGALKNLTVLEYAHHGYLSRNFQWAFVPVDPMNMRIKFEVRIALLYPFLR